MGDLCLSIAKGMDLIMWNDKKSLVLSKISVVIFMALMIVCLVFAPRLVTYLIELSSQAAASGKTVFLITIYVGAVPAAGLLVCLYVLLHRIGSGLVFVKENTTCLRLISWCCFVGAVVALASGVYYLPWVAVGVAAAFMGLVVRVVKNVVAKAVSLQDDADYTI